MPDAPYVFISYASADRERVLPLVERLETSGVRVWIDREGIHGGANYALEITEGAGRSSAAILLMCSETSLNSRNVKQEIALGWKSTRPYVPLLLEPVTIPGEVEYWLEAAQWISLHHRRRQAGSRSCNHRSTHSALRSSGRTVTQPAPNGARGDRCWWDASASRGFCGEQLDQMLAGHGGTVLVGGEAGIGKTTLVEDLSIQGGDGSLTGPLGPCLRSLRHAALRSLAGDLPAVPVSCRSVAAGRFRPSSGNAEELDEGGFARRRLFEAKLANFFSAVATQRPLLLVLDDLHWFDQASLDFFRYLARQVASQRILLVATYRSG